MPALSASDMLRLWETGAALSPARRALRILAAASPETPVDALAALPVGRRDRRLLEIRQETFGPRMDSLVACPTCGERVEFQVDAPSILERDAGFAPAGDAELSAGEWRFRFRMPTAGDLAAAAECEDPARAVALLLERCVVAAALSGRAVPPADIPASALALVDQSLSQQDALAEIMLDFVCPGCGAAGQAPFDIARYLWEELRAEAMRVLREVHALARVYGWRETDILGLSAVRRHAYVELAGS